MSIDDDEQDRRLARRARLGDERAFAELVDRHRGPLVRWVARRSGRPELAEDAVQEGLIAAHRALRSGAAGAAGGAGGAPENVRAWLSTIAWRRAVDLVRREQPALALDEALADGGAAAGAVLPGPEATVLRALDLDRVVAAWAELPARQRAALRMSALEGRTLEEIGAALGVNAGTAKSLVARGRRTLAARLTVSELRCDDVRAQIGDATDRGVRLGADASRHVRTCRACAKAHRAARRRRRLHAAILSPPALLVSKLRDYVFALVGHEPQVSLATKVCAGACASALAGGMAAAPVATSTLAMGGGGAVILAAERPASAPVPVRLAPPAKKQGAGAASRSARGKAGAATAGAATATASGSAASPSTASTSATGGTTITRRKATTLVGTASAGSTSIATVTTTTANAPAHRPGEIARGADGTSAVATIASAHVARGADGERTPTPTPMG